MSRIAGILLGAGLSERMGRPKQLLPYRKTTLLGSVVAAAEGSRLDPVVVVVGAAAVEVEASLDTSRAKVVRNLRYHDGNLTSLQAGVAEAGDVDAVMLLLGDMPDVDAALLDELAAAWDRNPAKMQVTRYADGIGHPFVLAASLLEELDRLDGPKPLWRLAADRGDVTEVLVDRRRPRDVDTPEDYERLMGDESAEGAVEEGS